MNTSQYPSILLSKWLANNYRKHTIQQFQIVQLLFKITRDQLSVPIRNNGCLTLNNCIWPRNYLIHEIEQCLDHKIGKVSLSQGELDVLGCYVCKMCVQTSKIMADRKLSDFYYDRALDFFIAKAKLQYLSFFTQNGSPSIKKVQRHFRYSKLLFYASGGVQLQFSTSLSRTDNIINVLLAENPNQTNLSLISTNRNHQKQDKQVLNEQKTDLFGQKPSFQALVCWQRKKLIKLKLPTLQKQPVFRSNTNAIEQQSFAVVIQKSKISGELEMHVFHPKSAIISTYAIFEAAVTQAIQKQQLRLLKLKSKIVLYCDQFISIIQPKCHNHFKTSSYRQPLFQTKLEEQNHKIEDSWVLADPKNDEDMYLIVKMDKKASYSTYKMNISEETDHNQVNRLILTNSQQIEIKQQILTYFQEQQGVYLLCGSCQNKRLKVLKMQIIDNQPKIQQIIQFCIWVDGSALQIMPFRQQPFVYILVDMAAKMLPLRLSIKQKTVKGIKMSQMSDFIKDIYQQRYLKQANQYPASNVIHQQVSYQMLRHKNNYQLIYGCGGSWKTVNIHQSLILKEL